MNTKKKGTDGLLGNRLRAWRQSIHLKGYELSEKINISPGSLSEIESNNSLPSADTLAKLAKHSNLNILWLLTGDGNMFKKETPEFEDDIVNQELKDLFLGLKRIIESGDKTKAECLKGFIWGADPGK